MTDAAATIDSGRQAAAALAELGEPLPDEVVTALDRLDDAGPAPLEALDALLRPFTLADVALDPSGLARSSRSGADVRLVEHGWRSFLLRVENPWGLEHALATSHDLGTAIIANAGRNALEIQPQLWDRLDKSLVIAHEWLQARLAGEDRLSGIGVEYRVISLYSKLRGEQQAYLAFAATDDPGGAHRGRQGIDLEVDCAPAADIPLRIVDEDGRTTVAGLVIRDGSGRVHPARAMRLAPDMGFHDQIYRGSGETVRLPDGHYTVEAQRGPESLPCTTEVDVVDGTGLIEVEIRRWTRPERRGYYSGDPHIHAAGCSHYSIPTQGIAPESVVRLLRGEGLWVGSVLTWAPCYRHQRRFFSGASISPESSLEEPRLQAAQGGAWAHAVTDTDHETHLRYDVEVSGFPSSHSGHLLLLGLRDQDFPGTLQLEDWPSFSHPILAWAKAQGALVGFAHGGVGLAVDDETVPNFLMPRFRGIGMNEVIVDVAVGAADFVSGCQELPASELNAWYHLRNAGFDLLMTGETDYPCIYDTRPGVGRTYVELEQPPLGPTAVESWLGGLRSNRSYFGDGRSHLYDVVVDIPGSSTTGARRIEAPAPATALVTARAVAMLDPVQGEEGRRIAASAAHAQPAWHLERARIPGTRTVRAELVVNGIAVDSCALVADGLEHELRFEARIEASAWVAVRILPSVHSQPISVEIGGAPVRGSRRSIQWCLDAVDVLWEEKSPFIRETELDAARTVYDAARAEYRVRLEQARPGT